MDEIYNGSSPQGKQNQPSLHGNQKFSVFRHTWRHAVTADSKTRLTAFDKLVAVVICDAINDEKQYWMMSDELIAILIGKPGSASRVWEARKRLKAGGWLTWTRTRDANVYRLRGDNVMATLDEIMRQKGELKARQQQRQNQRGPYKPMALQS
jgi:hypothetical protein